MNKILYICCFLAICCVHLAALSTTIKKEPKKIDKPKYEKLSFQLVNRVEEKPKLEEKKFHEKKEIKKAYKKPIKKKAKRKFSKKRIDKKVIEKLVKKRKKRIEKKELFKKKINNTKIKKTVENASNKNRTNYLKRYKKFKVTYLTKLRAAIDKNKKYPRASVKLKEQGKASISFRVLKNGEFVSIQLDKSSGKKRLDKAALKAVINTSSFHSFPKDIKKEYMDVNITIEFKLK